MLRVARESSETASTAAAAAASTRLRRVSEAKQILFIAPGPRAPRSGPSLSHGAGQDDCPFEFAFESFQVCIIFSIEVDHLGSQWSGGTWRPCLGIRDEWNRQRFRNLGRKTASRSNAAKGPHASRCAFCSPHFVSWSRVHSLERFIPGDGGQTRTDDIAEIAQRLHHLRTVHAFVL